MALPSWAPVGRAPGSALRIDHPRVSGAHAVLAWTGSEWTIQDLASRNGTFVDGQRVEPGLRIPLVQGARLSFHADGEVWVLVDSAPPPARAVPEDGGAPVVGGPGLLALPDEQEPVAVVFPAPTDWVIELHGEQRPVADGDRVEVDGRRWALELPVVIPSTVAASAALRLADLALRFTVSADEEHVEIDAVHVGGAVQVPNRVHHYVLLTLARARLKDRARGVGPAEEGWSDVEVLARRLGLTGNAFHVQLCRARAQLNALGIEGASGLIERRSGGRVRLGVERLEVLRQV